MPHKIKIPRTRNPLPTREQVLDFIAANPGKAGKREIARAFAIHGEDRVALKALLATLKSDGEVEGTRKKLIRRDSLPEVMVLSIYAKTKDGDLLARPAEWDEELRGEPPVIEILPARMREKGHAPGLGDLALCRLALIDSPLPAGPTHRARIIKVISRGKAQAVGLFKRDGDGGRITPVDKKSMGKEWRVRPADTNGADDGDLVLIDIITSNRLGPPLAKVRERIGSIASEKAVSLIALVSHAIPHVFRKETMEEAEAAKPATMKKREDWTSLPLITIDPPDAKDHDDAVHAAADPDKEGGFIVTVAIADVGAYVRPGSALDTEARHRGNSVYFPDRVVPMLPERISNELCSLKPHEPRAALAVRMVINPDGRKTSHTFHRIMMRSAAKLSYQQAQDAIDGKTDDVTDTLLEPILKPLWAAYAAMSKARDKREPLELDLPERKIVLNPDGTVNRVVVPPRLDAHRLIEEMMISANVAAAETLEAKRTPLLYRVHDAPSPEKLSLLREFLQSLDITLPKQGNMRPSQFNHILAGARGKAMESMVSEMVLRSQAQAVYAPANIGHFGLNLRRYAHFTSPIRRYADLIVHRGIIRALELGGDGLQDREIEALEETAAQISNTERRAMIAERDTIDRLIAHFLSGQIGASFTGRIRGVTKAGLFVMLNETGADGFVPAGHIGNEYYRYDEATQALVGDTTGETYQLGDKVEVKLVEAQPIAGALRFEMLSDGRKGKPVRRGRHAEKITRAGRDKHQKKNRKR